MDLSGKISPLNSVPVHCNSDVTIPSAVHMLQQLLDSSIFNETEIKNMVALLKRIKNNVVHCDDLGETLPEKKSITQCVEDSSAQCVEDSSAQCVEDSSASAADVDEIIKRAESLLDIFNDQAFETKFNGETVDWFRFWEAFKNEIHNREDLPVALKFACLKERLEGWPLNMLEKLDSGDSVFDEALKLLHTTFNNKEALLESHLNALLNLDPAIATPVSLMWFSSEFEYHIKALKAYGTNIREVSSIVVPVLSEKIPKRIWNRINKADGTNYLNLLEFQNALKFEIQSFILEWSQQVSNHSAAGNKNVSIDSVGDDSACKSKDEDVKDFQDSSNYLLICQLCSGCHMLNDCILFRTPAEKMEKAKQLEFCLLCFNADHTTDECLETGCKFCSGRHSTLLCFSGTSEVESKKTKVEKKNNCQLCSQSHAITGCTVYKTSEEKLERANELQLCLLCINDGHSTENCLKIGGCKFCTEKHNTLLCVSTNSKDCNVNKNSKNSIKICILCSGSHCIDICSAYKTAAEKMERLKELKLCLLCMKDDHITEKCMKKRRCKFCEGNHSILFCLLAPSRFCNITSKKTKNKKPCLLCSKHHEMTGCTIYKTPAEKMERAGELNFCLVCINAEHTTEKCMRTTWCKLCKGKHNTLLCNMGIANVDRPQPSANRTKRENLHCLLCSGSKHEMGGCPKFNTPFKRHERALILNLCLLCLEDNHSTSECLSEKYCKFCKEKHNTLLHFQAPKPKEKKAKKQKQEGEKKQSKGLKASVQGIKSNTDSYKSFKCSLCSGNHHSFGCLKYASPVERRGRAVNLNLCLVCTSNRHFTSECSKPDICKFCHARHHSLLCVDTKARAKRRRGIRQEKQGSVNSKGKRGAISNNSLILDFISSSSI